MSIYGDMGNIIALKYRLGKLGFEVLYQEVNPGEELPEKTDFYFIGGGQDKEQLQIFEDLLSKKAKLLNEIEQNVPVLAICGGYQLLGQSFLTGDGKQIAGIGILPVDTKAPDLSVKSRCIGNIAIKSNIPELKDVVLVGFENHSGQTYFKDGFDTSQVYPLGEVIFGFGNNSVEKIEGCVYKNVIGTYMHGSCLPKNPELSDYLIKKSIENKIGNNELPVSFLENNIFEKLSVDIALKAKNHILNKY